MKKILPFFIIIILLICGVGYSYYNFTKPIAVTEIKDSIFSSYLKNETETFKESTDWYEVSIDYPKDNQKVRDEILEMWNNFEKENQLKKYKTLEEAKEGLQINVEGLKYAFNAEYKIANSKNTLTYVYQIYTFTGGAHGGTIIYPITFNEKLEKMKSTDVLPDSQLEKVAKLSEIELKKQKYQRLKSYGNMTEEEINEIQKNDDFLSEGVKPIRENYNSVWYDGDDIVISFGQYQVASYAEGMFEVRIPRSLL